MSESDNSNVGERVSERRRWITALVTLTLVVATALVALYLLREATAVECFGCDAASSVSNAPGP